jgi:hypothetical protein
MIYDGYNGVFLKSNTASTGDTYDAYFIPGNAKSVVIGTYASGMTTPPPASTPSAELSRLAVSMFVYNKAPNKVSVFDETSTSTPKSPVIAEVPTTVGSPVFRTSCEPVQ